MGISLYEVSVQNYLQTVTGVRRFLEKSLLYCRDHNINLEEIVESRVFPDMLPFRYQIQSVAHHSLGAAQAILSGVFHPSSDLEAHNYEGLQALIIDTQKQLQMLTPDDINKKEGAEVVIETHDRKLLFTTLGFVTSCSLPNFYFHATTAYNILRSKGVPLGKRDYLGTMRVKM